MTMSYENEKIQTPATEEIAQVEETLQIEELEARVAPSTVWGS
jgi:hypothetical protein